MKRIHLDTYSALIGIIVLIGTIWVMLAILNPVR